MNKNLLEVYSRSLTARNWNKTTATRVDHKSENFGEYCTLIQNIIF